MSGSGGLGFLKIFSRDFVNLPLFFISARVRRASMIWLVIFSTSRAFSCHALRISFFCIKSVSSSSRGLEMELYLRTTWVKISSASFLIL
jgi:hypothetical protein